MAISAHILASGTGWSVCDVVCDHGPRDRAFVEEHAQTTIAAVMSGSFQYRTQVGSTVLVPGALLLGNAGACFECGHEHAQGDRCLAFHFTPHGSRALRRPRRAFAKRVSVAPACRRRVS
jgi:AraC family transcriptional regulator